MDTVIEAIFAQLLLPLFLSTNLHVNPMPGHAGTKPKRDI